MAFPIKRRRGVVKPSEPGSPDLGHPQLDNCVLWWNFLEGAGPVVRNLMRPAYFDGTPGSTTRFTWGGSDKGIAAKTSGSLSDNIRTSTGTLLTDADPCTIIVDFKYTASAGSNYRCVLGTSDSYTNGLKYYDYRGDHAIYDLNREYTGSPISIGDVQQVAIVCEAGTGEQSKRLYLNGNLDISWSKTKRALTELNLSYGGSGSTGDWTGCDFYQVRVYREVLSEAKIRDIYENPWAPIDRRIFIPTEVGVPLITGTGTLQAQDASVSGAGDVIAVVTGDGILQAQPAAVSGVGDLISAIEGIGTLQAGDAAVTGAGAIVQDGTGILQAQDAAVVGIGEVGNVRVGTGTLQARDATVFGEGDRASVGTGTLQAQDAAVTGIGEVEGLTTGTGTLQAQPASISGQGELTFEGAGALQAQSASVVGAGFLLGDLTLTPGDIAAIQQAVWAAPEAQQLIARVNEIWQRRGLDSANPQTYDKAGKQIRVGGITIDLTGDANEVTQTRQP